MTGTKARIFVNQPAAEPAAGEYAVSVVLPCYNEATTIAEVVGAFRRALPEAAVYVYDNNSTDNTALLARDAGAVVRRETMRGKGHVVRRMFADVEADVYVIADGDGTYPSNYARAMIDALVADNLDMVVGARSQDDRAYPRGHRLGNRVFNRAVALLFGRGFTDIFSGYRVLSRRFVKSFPALATGFEIETELSVHALELNMPTAELVVPYGARAAGSSSKLSTVRDGLRIAWTVVLLLKEVRPLGFFSVIAGALAVLALGLAYPLLPTWMETGLVPRFPTAILATGIVLLAFLSLTCGFVLDSVARGRREAKRMHYLAIPGVSTRP